MKTLIFSDTHLTHTFDVLKCEFLDSLFSSVDRIIINGDFWDGYETTFEKFSRSQWKALFPILLKKKAIYIFGNHDRREWIRRPELFSVEQYDKYVLQAGNHELLIEHGHRITPSFDITYPKLSYVLSSFISSKRLQFNRRIPGWYNMQMKHYVEKNLLANQILICGHSHIPENNRKHQFINCGTIDYGVASFVLVDGSRIQLMTQTYG